MKRRGSAEEGRGSPGEAAHDPEVLQAADDAEAVVVALHLPAVDLRQDAVALQGGEGMLDDHAQTGLHPVVGVPGAVQFSR